MNRKLTILLCIAFAFSPFSQQLYSQSNPTGTIEGWVDDLDYQPLSGVNVYLRGTTIGTTTDADGDFVLSQVPIGSYTLVVSHIGYEAIERVVDLTVESDPVESFYMVRNSETFSSSDDVQQDATGTIEGWVLDNLDYEPLSGANVYLQGTTIGTTTDAEGDFVLSQVPIGSYTLVVSYIGYEAIERVVDLTVEPDPVESFYMVRNSETFSWSDDVQQDATGTIEGWVLNGWDEEPLWGANVYLQGTGISTAADVDGYFTISQVPFGSYVVEVSYFGFSTIEENIEIWSETPVTRYFFMYEEYYITGSRSFESIFSSLNGLSRDYFLLAIALMYFGIFSQRKLPSVFSAGAVRIILGLAVGIVGLHFLLFPDANANYYYYGFLFISHVILGMSFLAFSICIFIRKRVKETAVIFAGTLILYTFISFLLELVFGYALRSMIIYYMTNLILAGGALLYAGEFLENKQESKDSGIAVN